jgi:hypothetical protein
MAKKQRQQKQVRWWIDLLLDAEVTTLYKHFSGVTVIKFKDREDAETRLLNITYGKLTATLMQGFKECGLSDEVIRQFNGRIRGPIAFPEGGMQPDDLKKHAKALGAGKQEGAKQRTLRDASAAVLLALRELIPVDAKGEDATINTTVVAQKLNTNVNQVCRSCDQLAKQKLIEIEDDSNLEHQLYWLKLLPAGRTMDVAPPSVKLPASNPGPRAGFSGKRIYRIAKTNPRREGTWGWKSFNLITDGMTFEEYKNKGGRNNDLQWDIDKKFVELRSDGEEAPKQEAAEAAPTPKSTINKKGRQMLPPGKRAKKVRKAPAKKAKAAGAGGKK